MAEFGSNITEAPDVQTAITPKAGVITESPSGVMDHSAIDTAFGVATQMLKAFNKDGRDKEVAAFSRAQLKIADAYAQGKISSAAEARSRMRTNLLNAMESRPDDVEFYKSLWEVQGKMLGISGGAGIVDDMTDEERRRVALRDTMVSNGVVSATASEKDFQEAEREYVTAAEASRKYKLEMDAIAKQKAELELSAAERKKLEAQEESLTVELFNNTATVELNSLRSEFDRVLKSTASPAEKRDQINLLYNDYLTDTNPYMVKLTEEKRKLYKTPFERIRDMYLEAVTGKTRLEDLQNDNTRILETQKSILLADPNIAQSAALSKMFDFGAFEFHFQTALLEPVLKILAGNNGGDTTLPGIGSGNNPFDGVKNTASAIGNILTTAQAMFDSGDPELQEDAFFQVDAILGNIADNEATLRGEAKKGRHLIETLANPAFGEMMKKNPEAFTNKEEASRIISEHWVDEVLGLVEREFKNSGVITPNVEPSMSMPFGSALLQLGDAGQPTPQAVTYETTSAGMKFVPVDQNDAEAVRKANELNRVLKPIINKTVQADANLKGDTNYGKAWEGFAERLLGPKQTNNSDDDELLLEDFESGNLDPKFDPVLKLIDRTETKDGDYDTLLGHTDNSKFSNVKVSQMTLDEVIAFQKSPSYRKHSLDTVGRIATPVGRYQIVGSTLRSLKTRLNLSGEEMFDKDLQDRLFVALINDRLRKSNGNVNEAVSQLRNEWEGLNHISFASLKQSLEGLL